MHWKYVRYSLRNIKELGGIITQEGELNDVSRIYRTTRKNKKIYGYK